MHSSLAQVMVKDVVLKQFQEVPGLRGIGADPENRNLSSFRSERDLDLILVCEIVSQKLATSKSYSRMRLSQGKTALMASPFVPANVDTAIAEIKRLVGITFARATIKCAGKPTAHWVMTERGVMHGSPGPG